jgi:hypothetical protein
MLGERVLGTHREICIAVAGFVGLYNPKKGMLRGFSDALGLLEILKNFF